MEAGRFWSHAGYMMPALLKTFKLRSHEMAYLSRGACVHWAPTVANSKLIAFSLKRETMRGAKLAIAFSDTDAGEIGTVYQAANWTYCGKYERSGWAQFVSPKGILYSYQSFTEWCKQYRLTTPQGLKAFEDAGWRIQKPNPKHRYVYLLDKGDRALFERVESMGKPYPKRGKQATTGDHPDSGGAAPTSTLQGNL